MALISKIFHRKNSRNVCYKWPFSEPSRGSSVPNFNKDNVRLVVIWDRYTEDRKVLYDSKWDVRSNTTQDGKKPVGCRAARWGGKPPIGKSNGCPRNTTEGPKEKPQISSDCKLLGEMMFGSIPMRHSGSALKVHTIRSPPQLMVTKVFTPSESDRDSSGFQDSFDLYSIQGMPENSVPQTINTIDKAAPSIAHSVPVDVPSPPTRGQRERENEDSGISASVASSSSSFTTPGLSPSSSASINSHSLRRFIRHQTTSLEYTLTKRHSEERIIEPKPIHQRPPKFGLAIIFNLPEEDTESFRLFQNFFFSHITLIESHVLKLRVSVEKALPSRNRQMVQDALEVFRGSIFDLYTAPRLSEPVWLNMMCHSTHRVLLCQQFLKEFMTLVEKYDTKNTKFFVSTLVTAVLTHHLAWVPTVTPAGASASNIYVDKHSAKWVNALAKSHPYNPLWAQLGDLYGAVGFPLRLSRTVVVGGKPDLVCKLLYVLSYFMRCSEVSENTLDRQPLDRVSRQSEVCENTLDRVPLDRVSRQSEVDHVDIPGAAMGAIDEGGGRGDDGGGEGAGCHGGNTNPVCRKYGSITSCGTVVQNFLQTSTDTMISLCPDPLLPGSPQTCAFDPEPPCQPAASLGTAAPGDCASGDADRDSLGNHGDATTVDKDATTPSGCEDCRALRQRRPDSLHAEKKDGYYGNSVFYCCADSDMPEEASGCICDESRPQRTTEPLIPGKKSNRPTKPPKPALFVRIITEDSEVISTGKLAENSVVPDNEIREQGVETQTAEPVVTSTDVKSSDVTSAEATSAKVTSAAAKPTPESGVRCRESPTDVQERVQCLRIRYVGREATASRFDFSGDSGVFEGPKPHPDGGRAVATRDSGLGNGPSPFPDTPSPGGGPRRPSDGDEPWADSGTYDVILGETEVSRAERLPVSGDTVVACHVVGDTTIAGGRQPEVTTELSSSTDRQICSSPRSPLTDVDSHSTPAVRKSSSKSNLFPRVLVDRTNSLFDEYFPDDENAFGLTDIYNTDIFTTYMTDPELEIDNIIDNSSVNTQRVIQKNAAAEDGSGGGGCPAVHAKGKSPVLPRDYKRLSSVEGSISMFDEYFTADAEAVGLPEGSSKQMVASAIALMQEEAAPDGACAAPETQGGQPPRERLDSNASGGSTFTRQNSSASAGTQYRCRSATPTGSYRGRHLSTASNTSVDADCGDGLQDVPMPRCEVEGNAGRELGFDGNFGRSLFAGYTDHYMSDFVLHGTSDTNYMARLHTDLTMAVQNSVLDECTAEAACIVADTDKWAVRLHTCQHSSADRVKTLELSASQLVCGIIESVHQMWKLKMSPEFCGMHLEDRLQEIYFKSQMLAEYIKMHKRLDVKELSTTLGFDVSDLPLLLAVAGTHTPNLASDLII